MVWKGTCMPTEVSPKRYLYLSIYQRIVMASWKQLEKTPISTGVSDCQWQQCAEVKFSGNYTNIYQGPWKLLTITCISSVTTKLLLSKAQVALVHLNKRKWKRKRENEISGEWNAKNVGGKLSVVRMSCVCQVSHQNDQ